MKIRYQHHLWSPALIHAAVRNEFHIALQEVQHDILCSHNRPALWHTPPKEDAAVDSAEDDIG
jgi:hypothetical protein